MQGGFFFLAVDTRALTSKEVQGRVKHYGKVMSRSWMEGGGGDCETGAPVTAAVTKHCRSSFSFPMLECWVGLTLSVQDARVTFRCPLGTIGSALPNTEPSCWGLSYLRRPRWEDAP